MTDFETAVQNLIDVMVDHDAWLRAENEALAGIASDLYFLIKPNASIPVDWVFATLTTVVSGYLRARRGIRETEKDPAARDSRLARANDVAVRNLKLLPANGQDPELTALGTKVPAVSGEEGFRLVADYLAKILKIHYRRFSDPKSFFPAPAPPTTPARAIPFDVPAAVPENVPENVPTSRPSPQAQSSRPAPVPQAAPAPPRPVISGGQQALPDIHSKDYPMIRVALKPLTPDTGAIFENVMDSVRKLNFFKAASGQKL
ncbi:MAG: hypothetical protein LBF41_03805, partial [Deltaproteobacteria bacterium]|nr:hypothetical protein [Deltaproteobacteria bacterium]